MDSREPTRLAPSEPPGMMVGPNSYGSGLQNNQPLMPSSAGGMQGMRLSFNTMASSPTKPVDSLSPLYHGDGALGMRPCGGLSMSEPVKKKRGRPRKYGPDGTMSLGLTPLSSVSGHPSTQSSDTSAKRRGRPPGSGKKQQLDALGSAGNSFTPHVITVSAGEDVASKIMAFSQQGSRTVCILSANGVICNVSLRQPATSGGTVTYEGRFEILSLSGSFLLTEDGGTRSRTGGLSVALASSNGRVVGGGVAGMLVAASPVQVVIASFIAEGTKPKVNPLTHEPSSATPQMTGFGGPSVASPPSQGTVSESSDDEDTGSPPNQSAGACNNSSQHVQNMSPYTSVGWTHPLNHHRSETDMKMMPN